MQFAYCMCAELSEDPECKLCKIVQAVAFPYSACPILIILLHQLFKMSLFLTSYICFFTLCLVKGVAV